MSCLDVTKATNLLREPCKCDRRRRVFRGKSLKNLVEEPLVVADQLSLGAKLPVVREDVEDGTA